MNVFFALKGSKLFIIINEATLKDSYPLARIDDSLDVLGKNKYFSVMDFSSRYLQAGIHPDKAFVTGGGLYNV